MYGKYIKYKPRKDEVDSQCMAIIWFECIKRYVEKEVQIMFMGNKKFTLLFNQPHSFVYTQHV